MVRLVLWAAALRRAYPDRLLSLRHRAGGGWEVVAHVGLDAAPTGDVVRVPMGRVGALVTLCNDPKVARQAREVFRLVERLVGRLAPAVLARVAG